MISIEQTYQAALTMVDEGVLIERLTVPSQELNSYLSKIPVDDQVGKLLSIVEIGLYCIQRASDARDTEFVKSRIEGLLTSVETAVSGIPGNVKSRLVESIGTGEGQVLESVARVVGDASKSINEGTSAVRELLEKEMDPGKETSAMGKVLKQISKSVDPEIKTSIPSTFESAIDRVISPSGQLSKSVKEVVQDALKPLNSQLAELGKEFRSREAVAEALDRTTEKGYKYEDQVVEELNTTWGTRGARIEYCGPDNKPGDVVVTITEDMSMCKTDMPIVIEVKDRQGAKAGRRVISDAMEASMEARGCQYGLYLAKDLGAFAKEIGDWAEGECNLGRWVAVTHGNLDLAVRYLAVINHMAELKNSNMDIDVDTILLQVERVNTTLRRVNTITSKSTQVRNAAQVIQDEAADLKYEVRDAMKQVEQSLLELGQQSNLAA